VGEKVTADSVTFEVLSVTGRRIRKVRALRTASVDAPPAPDADEHPQNDSPSPEAAHDD
jgi:hypothetical protein